MLPLEQKEQFSGSEVSNLQDTDQTGTREGFHVLPCHQTTPTPARSAGARREWEPAGLQGQRLNHTSLISLEQTSPSSTLREPSSATAAATSLTVSSSGEVPITRDQSPHEVLVVAVSQLRGFSWCWLTLAAVSAPSASAVVFPSCSPTTSPCLLEFLANRSAQQGGSSSPREASG